MSKPGLGIEQRKWLKRIQSAGGSVEIEVVETPIVWLKVEGNRAIRIPLRMFESFMERGMFKRIDDGDHWAGYQLVEAPDGQA